MTHPIPETNAAPLVITMFGSMEVFVASQALPHLHSRKSLWLLALLTLRPGRPVEREWLAGTLWPEADQEQAFNNLRPVLSDLRKVLGTESARLQSPNRPTLSLDLSGAFVDVLEFDAAITRQTLPDLARAVELYRGPLLEDCTEEWVSQECRKREQACLHALQTLSEAALATKDFASAIAYSRRAVAIAPWGDAAQRGLMEALAQSGDTNAALQIYREFIELLRNDPKAAPDAQTKALYDGLRSKIQQRASAPAKLSTTKEKATTLHGYIPHPPTDIVGRDDEMLAVSKSLHQSRLVTLTGSGGIGKTRLALKVADNIVNEFQDGVWLVALDALSEGAQVVPQIANALGVREELPQILLDALTDHLRHKRLLLMLDNCEHLLDSSAQTIGHLLRECAHLRVLSTSREPLGITGEAAWRVPSLAIPEASLTHPAILIGYESMQLFVERAQTAQDHFQFHDSNAHAIAQICAHLEGIPLAIELAAARVATITVEQIAERLHDHLGLLADDNKIVLSRQQTLRATLDWSYALLSEPEQILLKRLSVFAGGCILEAAESVCAGNGIAEWQVLDLLTSLVDKSLVVFEERDPDIGGRYRLLETIRQYAAEHQEISEEADCVRARHRDWFLALAEEAASGLKGGEQKHWLRRLETEHDNLRAAVDWSESDAHGAQASLRMTNALFLFWHMRGHISEGRQRLKRGLEREDAQVATLARAQALTMAGNLAYTQGDVASVQALYEESLSIYRVLGDKKGTADTLNNLANTVARQGNITASQAFHEESLQLFREIGEWRGAATALGNLGSLARQQGDYPLARKRLEESLSIHRSQADLMKIAMALNNLGNIVRLQGDYVSSQALYEEALGIRRELEDKPGTAWSLSSLGLLALVQGDYASAQALHEQSLSIRRELGNKNSIAWSLNNLGLVAQAQGIFASAQKYYAESLIIFQEIDDQQGCAWSLNYQGIATQSQGNAITAAKLHQKSLSIFQELGDREGAAASLKEFAAALSGQAALEKAACLWGAAQSLRESIGAQMPPSEQERYEHQVAQARTALGEDAFDTAWRAGKALTWEQAVVYAMEEIQNSPGVAPSWTDSHLQRC